MRLSNTELEYLRQSLTGTQIVRPDSRKSYRARPVDTDIDILPMANGSAQVRAADGSECIVGIKAKVVPTHRQLIDVSVDISGLKDIDALPNSLSVVLKQVLNTCPEITQGSLIINPKYAFRLYVDCVVVSHTSNPLSILSIAIFLALISTRLPRSLGVAGEDRELIKNGDEVEIPQFDDDWEASIPLCPSGWIPPLLFIVAFIGPNVVLDPTVQEEAVSEASMFITWKNGKVAAPIRTLDPLSGPFMAPFDSKLLFDAYDVVEKYAHKVVEDLMEK